MNIEAVIAQIPYARRMGIVAGVENDEVVTRMLFRDGLIGNQRIPALHGGVVGAFLEMAALAELIYRMGGEGIPKPINFNVNFLRSARAKDSTASGEVVKLGRKIALVRVAGWQGDRQKPFASGYGSFLL